jgi:hypothetical protein
MTTSRAKTAPLSCIECTEQKLLNNARNLGLPWKKWVPTSAKGNGGQ